MHRNAAKSAKQDDPGIASQHLSCFPSFVFSVFRVFVIPMRVMDHERSKKRKHERGLIAQRHGPDYSSRRRLQSVFFGQIDFPPQSSCNAPVAARPAETP
jgi:hypothetical protein